MLILKIHKIFLKIFGKYYCKNINYYIRYFNTLGFLFSLFFIENYLIEYFILKDGNGNRNENHGRNC